MVGFGERLYWAARGLFGYLSCASFVAWKVGQDLSRVDVLVVSNFDVASVPANSFSDVGFTGAIVYVDFGCDVRGSSDFSLIEQQYRLMLAGLVPPSSQEELKRFLAKVNFARNAELPSEDNRHSSSKTSHLFDTGGVPPKIIDALRCWDSKRALYVGADRRAAAAFAASLEVPPGVLDFLSRANSGDFGHRLRQLRETPSSPHPSERRPKLLAYLAKYPCNPAAEAFFDLAVKVFGDAGSGQVEALGDCHGSHPEARMQGLTEEIQRKIWQNPGKAFAEYRFVVAFEISAKSGYGCPRHIGNDGIVFESIAAGAIPVFHGPVDAGSVINQGAVVLLPPDSSAREQMQIFRAAAQCEGRSGWFDAGEDRSCDEGCADVGLVCSDAAMSAHNRDVDSSSEVLSLLKAAGGTTIARGCGTMRGAEEVAAPWWTKSRCGRSGAGRSGGSFNCSARPSFPDQGRHRLCFCHAAVGCSSVGNWSATVEGVPPYSARQWFGWDGAFAGFKTQLHSDLEAKLGPIVSGSPYSRCAAFGKNQIGIAGVFSACTVGADGQCMVT